MILQQLNTFAYEDNETLRWIYDFAVIRSPKFYDNYSYKEYIEFLYYFELIIFEEDRVKITILCVDF